MSPLATWTLPRQRLSLTPSILAWPLSSQDGGCSSTRTSCKRHSSGLPARGPSLNDQSARILAVQTSPFFMRLTTASTPSQSGRGPLDVAASVDSSTSHVASPSPSISPKSTAVDAGAPTAQTRPRTATPSSSFGVFQSFSCGSCFRSTRLTAAPGSSCTHSSFSTHDTTSTSNSTPGASSGSRNDARSPCFISWMPSRSFAGNPKGGGGASAPLGIAGQDAATSAPSRYTSSSTSQRQLGCSHDSESPPLNFFLSTRPSWQTSSRSKNDRSSISKSKDAFAGILGGLPDAPYAFSAQIVNLAISPTRIVGTASDQPWITPAPTVNSNGVPRSRDESNLVPSSVSVPT
mmetsp:Transcript_22145/g.69309  ORF Transcript_22145/g.69309 Transcript_22145/m.69309 type:complete len:348 (+) Transcript_22145:571-1614(+)